MLKKSFRARTLFKIRERLYIVPTLAGLGLFLFTIAVLLMSAVYSNAGLQLMGFFVLGLFSLAMTWTHAELRGLQILSLQVPFQEAGSRARINLRFLSKRAFERKGVRINFRFRELGTQRIWECEALAEEIKEKGEVSRSLKVLLPPRGHYLLEKSSMLSRSPFGLFRVWCRLSHKSELWVYPQAKKLPPPSFKVLGQNKKNQTKSGDENFLGVRESYEIQSSSRVVPKPPRSPSMLLMKEFEAESGQELLIDWNLLSGDFETKLSYCAEAARLSQSMLVEVSTPFYRGILKNSGERDEALKAWAQAR